MRLPLSTALVLLLFSFSVICQAETLTRRFVVEFEQTKQSFSIKRDPNMLPGDPSVIPDTNALAGSDLPSDYKPPIVGNDEAKKTTVDYISLRLLFATHLLVAYELVLATNGGSPNSKPYSWVPAEAFVAVGLLLKSYWNPDSPLYSPTEELDLLEQQVERREAIQDHPFAITTMMLPGNGQQQGQQQNQKATLSGQQVSGMATHTSCFTNSLSFGSGGGHEGPGQHQHTLGLNCYVDSCSGVCKLQQLFADGESTEGLPNSIENSTEHAHHAMTETQPFQLYADAFTFTMEIDPINNYTLSAGAAFENDAAGSIDYEPVTCGCGTICINFKALLNHQKRDHGSGSGRSEQRKYLNAVSKRRRQEPKTVNQSVSANFGNDGEFFWNLEEPGNYQSVRQKTGPDDGEHDLSPSKDKE
ncbi:hypothetical protein [Endozoicomonas sp. ONNA1]|uniref:hypothetical protein n=1 Tax=Endozoicomonas sp. ONNA1 TaxID=2828740 RepID=UPI0021484CA0|nr:hypothetical protein [Endozoicomonas sp. ONNA1]